MLAGLLGDRSIRDVCREQGISETLYFQWRDRLLEAGKEALRRRNEKRADDHEVRDLKMRVAHLERALGRKTYRLEVVGELLGDWT